MTLYHSTPEFPTVHTPTPWKIKKRSFQLTKRHRSCPATLHRSTFLPNHEQCVSDSWNENLNHAGNAISGGWNGEFSGLKGKKEPLQDEICFNRVAYFPDCLKSIPQLKLPQCKACILGICLAWQIVFGNMAFMPISLGEKRNLFNPLVLKPLGKKKRW